VGKMKNTERWEFFVALPQRERVKGEPNNKTARRGSEEKEVTNPSNTGENGGIKSIMDVG